MPCFNVRAPYNGVTTGTVFNFVPKEKNLMLVVAPSPRVWVRFLKYYQSFQKLQRIWFSEEQNYQLNEKV